MKRFSPLLARPWKERWSSCRYFSNIRNTKVPRMWSSVCQCFRKKKKMKIDSSKMNSRQWIGKEQTFLCYIEPKLTIYFRFEFSKKKQYKIQHSILKSYILRGRLKNVVLVNELQDTRKQNLWRHCFRVSHVTTRLSSVVQYNNINYSPQTERVKQKYNNIVFTQSEETGRKLLKIWNYSLLFCNKNVFFFSFLLLDYFCAHRRWNSW